MTLDPDSKSTRPDPKHSTPFGEQNRRRLIAEFFAQQGTPDPDTAWKRVYGLLLWVDRTTGLAHCYESDKCQPGRRWYGRSLAFHQWLAHEFQSTPVNVVKQLDWLFEKALEQYLRLLAREQSALKERGARQRSVFTGQVFPLPGSDPEVQRIVRDSLKSYFTATPPSEVFDLVAERLREYWRQENKRKNLLGEGFEDVLSAVVEFVVGHGVEVRARTRVAEISGFFSPGTRDKATKVDIVIECPAWSQPALVNVKWSIRADREDQLWDDFKEYVRFDRNHRGFEHYLITNEFDPARLNAVCDRREANNFVFKNVVHINTDGLLAAYQPTAATALVTESPKPNAETSMERVRRQVKEGRLISLSQWLKALSHG